MALSTSSKRVALDLNNELIGKLLAPFDQKGFDKLVKTAGKAAPYKLPEIVFSNKKRFADYDVVQVLPYPKVVEVDKKANRIALLGCYENYSLYSLEEGRVIIYYETIGKSVKAYRYANPTVTSSEEECFEALVNVVTLHELAHWLLHYIMDFAPIEYRDRESIYFHEGFAQLFTWLTIEKQEGADGELMRNLFLWLAEKQLPAYRKYKELTEVNSDELITIEKAIEILKSCSVHNLGLSPTFSLAMVVNRMLSFKLEDLYRTRDNGFEFF